MSAALKFTDMGWVVPLPRRPANGHIIAINDNGAPSRGTGYSYDAPGDLTGFTDATGAVTTYSDTPPGGPALLPDY